MQEFCVWMTWGASVCMGIQKFFIVEYNIETAKVGVLLIPNGILFTIMD